MVPRARHWEPTVLCGPEVGLKENTEDIQKITLKEDSKHRECGQRTGVPNLPLLGTADSEMDKVRGLSWEGVKSIPRHTTYHRTVDGRETPVQRLPFCLRIIYNRPPSSPNQVAFYKMQGSEGRLLLPRSSTITLLLDLQPDFFYWMSYDHFSARSLLAKLGRWGWWWLERKARRH